MVSFVACDYSQTKMYEFLVENQLSDKTVKIVPKSKTDFWISSYESYIVVPGEKIIIGSKIDSYIKRKAPDIYKPNDIIAPFDERRRIYINQMIL